jgi:hypothetical protein
MMEESERDLLIKLLTKVEHIETTMSKMSATIEQEYRELEKRVGKVENHVTALQTKLAIYGAIIILLAPLLSTLLNYILNSK